MNLSRFFIDRPIFAGVISFLIFLAGLISMFQLPISEYPEVVPPTVVVTRAIPRREPEGHRRDRRHAAGGADQRHGEHALHVLAGLERRHAHADRHLQARHRPEPRPAAGAEPRQRRRCRACRRSRSQIGVTTVKSSPDLTMVVHLTSPDNRYDMLYLRNYAVLNVKDQLAKIDGVGNVGLFGSGDYAMRIWLNPEKVAELRPDRRRRRQRHPARRTCRPPPASSAGRPTARACELQLPVNAQGRLSDPEQFGDIIIKRNADGAITRSAGRRAHRDRRVGSTACARCSTTSRPSPSRSSSRPAPTRSRSPTRCAPPWRS